MSEEMFVALMNGIVLLGQKERRTKEETLTYDYLLAYAGSVTRFNRLVVEEAIHEKLESYDRGAETRVA
jgi:hypothetical protein